MPLTVVRQDITKINVDADDAVNTDLKWTVGKRNLQAVPIKMGGAGKLYKILR